MEPLFDRAENTNQPFLPTNAARAGDADKSTTRFANIRARGRSRARGDRMRFPPRYGALCYGVASTVGEAEGKIRTSIRYLRGSHTAWSRCAEGSCHPAAMPGVERGCLLLADISGYTYAFQRFLRPA